MLKYLAVILATPLPSGADVISLIRVALDHPDEKVLNILRAIRKVIPDNGIVLIAKPKQSRDVRAWVAAQSTSKYFLPGSPGRHEATSAAVKFADE